MGFCVHLGEIVSMTSTLHWACQFYHDQSYRLSDLLDLSFVAVLLPPSLSSYDSPRSISMTITAMVIAA